MTTRAENKQEKNKEAIRTEKGLQHKSPYKTKDTELGL